MEIPFAFLHPSYSSSPQLFRFSSPSFCRGVSLGAKGGGAGGGGAVRGCVRSAFAATRAFRIAPLCRAGASDLQVGMRRCYGTGRERTRVGKAGQASVRCFVTDTAAADRNLPQTWGIVNRTFRFTSRCSNFLKERSLFTTGI